LDLEKSDAEIWAETEAICRADPAFEPAESWARRFNER
jgi:catechol 2,3-dioxygenase